MTSPEWPESGDHDGILSCLGRADHRCARREAAQTLVPTTTLADVLGSEQVMDGDVRPPSRCLGPRRDLLTHRFGDNTRARDAYDGLAPTHAERSAKGREDGPTRV